MGSDQNYHYSGIMQTSFEAGLQCTQCSTPLGDDDGHLLCPPCLGTEHLQEALSDPCSNCAIMTVEQRQTRLASLATSQVLGPPVGSLGNRRPHKRRSSGVMAAEPKKKRSSPVLARQVDTLSADVEQIKSMLMAWSVNSALQTADSEESDDTKAGLSPHYSVQ